MSGAPFTIACAQHAVGFVADADAWQMRLQADFAAGTASGAQLLVWPEYASLELAALLPAAQRAGLGATLTGLQALLPMWLDAHRRLAIEHGVYVLAGSFPVATAGGYRNRAWLIAPDGRCGWQDKQMMTRFERELWGISAGSGLRVFDTALGCIGIAICYDAEFPLLVRRLVEAGANLILVPSCTDSLAGWARVRIGAQARALENQCAVAMAALVGEAGWSAAIDVNHGAAGIFAPPERGLPDDGVLAIGEPDRGGWVTARIEPARFERVRRNGQVLNHRDWAAQPGSASGDVQRIGL